MQSIVNTIKGRAIDLAAQITPVLKESKFRETGMLTPEEFVAAGDHLVSTCPTWAWAKGDASNVKKYLPEDKQFLVTKNVPSHKRCRDMEYSNDVEKVIDDGEEGEGWVDTHHFAEQPQENKVTEAANEEDADDGEAIDMDEFLENMDEDTASAAVVKRTDDQDQGVLSSRTYDLNITYDNYYRTPRLWLTGYDENHKPLTTKGLYEDISQDFAKKTVTVEPHPHVSGPPQASVHPCRHATAMKSLIQTVEDGGGSLEVHMYLIVFLKFVQAVIPTIEYDYTANFNMG